MAGEEERWARSSGKSYGLKAGAAPTWKDSSKVLRRKAAQRIRARIVQRQYYLSDKTKRIRMSAEKIYMEFYFDADVVEDVIKDVFVRLMEEGKLIADSNDDDLFWLQCRSL